LGFFGLGFYWPIIITYLINNKPPFLEINGQEFIGTFFNKMIKLVKISSFFCLYLSVSIVSKNTLLKKLILCFLKKKNYAFFKKKMLKIKTYLG